MLKNNDMMNTPWPKNAYRLHKNLREPSGEQIGASGLRGNEGKSTISEHLYSTKH